MIIKYFILLNTFIFLTCSFGSSESNSVVTVSDSEIRKNITYMNIEFQNLPDSMLYKFGDEIVFDLEYNIADEDFSDSIKSVFKVFSAGSGGGTYIEVATDKTDSLNTYPLNKQNGTIQFKTDLYHPDHQQYDSTRYISNISFAIECFGFTLRYSADLWERNVLPYLSIK